MRTTRAEDLLKSLGIDQAGDIDLEAIAWRVGAKVRYRHLKGCEARIVGLDDKAIITVNCTSGPERQRFSVGHELGHWAHHRGQCAVCRASDIGNFGNIKSMKERAADSYAADLLMPWYLFKPSVRNYKRLDLKTLRAVATEFSTSLTATLIRMIESDMFPSSMVVAHRPAGRAWFRASPSVSGYWFPQAELDQDSFAFTLMHGQDGRTEGFPRKTGADAWFDKPGADQHEITEQSFKLPNGDVITILNLADRMVS
ncbi:MAG: ImmA/IrrE family metallo-endopeptidase [Mesorhizobium sp.]|nr:MAG: ImmA/IrrE family metallo-endopeptidase [Mesorhizobium sp.]